MANVTWMWGDATAVLPGFQMLDIWSLGHELSQRNPLRWSRAKSVQEALEELEAFDTKGLQRSVLISLTVSGEKHRYPQISDALADLRKMLQDDAAGDVRSTSATADVTSSSAGEVKGCSLPPAPILPNSEAGDKVSSSSSSAAGAKGGFSDASAAEFEGGAAPASAQAPRAASSRAEGETCSSAAEVEGGLLPSSCLTQESHGDSTPISDDGIMKLLLAGGRDELLGLWLQQQLALVSLRADLVSVCSDPTACEDKDVQEACKGIHRALAAIVAADELENILGCEAQLQAAPLVLRFLVEHLGNSEGGLRETLAKDLATLLGLDSWRDIFENEGLFCQLPDDCRYTIASAGISFISTADVSALEPAASMHDDQIKLIVQDALQKATTELVDAGARIVILGDRGAGKSSICNAAFGDVVAAAGAGRPVTTGISLYEATETCPVHIYDTKGFETLCDNSDALLQLKELVEERREAVSQYAPDDPAAVKEQLHAIWWVIDVVGGGRFNPKSVESVARLFSDTGVPIIMVLNKCDVEESYVKKVESDVKEHCLWASSVVRVVAHPRLGPIAQLCEQCGSSDIEINCKRMCYSCEACDRSRVPFQSSYGFDDLVQVTIQCLPKMVSASFMSAQKVWLEGLDRVALRDIAIFGAAAGGMGATPLPFLTHFALFPLQVALVVRLASIYGIIMSWKTALHIVCSLGVVSSVGLLGWTSANALKMVPGLNTVGCVSDAFISAGFTIAIGLVVRTMLRRVRSKAAGLTEVQPEELAAYMSVEERRSLFTEYFNRLRAPLMELMEDAHSVSIEALEHVVMSATINQTSLEALEGAVMSASIDP